MMVGKITCKINACSRVATVAKMCRRHYDETPHLRYVHRPAIVNGEKCLIPLGINAKDGYSTVDLEFRHLDEFKWSLNSNGYAVAAIDGKLTYLHKLVFILSGQEIPTKYLIDHINQDKLNNCLSNLRAVSKTHNQINAKSKSSNTSGYRGVSFDKARSLWRAAIRYENKNFHIGRFKTALEAAKAYDSKAKELHGEFAVLNEAVRG